MAFGTIPHSVSPLRTLRPGDREDDLALRGPLARAAEPQSAGGQATDLALLRAAGGEIFDTTPAADATLSQNWSNTGLITANDQWGSVPSIVGFFLDSTSGVGTSGATNPQDVLTDTGFTVDVIAQSTPANTAGGVHELDGLPNPVVGFQGSGTARATGLLFYVNATGREDVTFSALLRDVDTGTTSAQPVAFQYRIGNSGNFTNIASAYVANANLGGDIAVSFTLPDITDDQGLVQIRAITTDASGSDAMIGVDDIVISSAPIGAVGPGTLSIADSSVSEGDSGTTLMTFTVTRTGGSSGAVGATWTVALDGTADSDDLAVQTGTVSLADGDTSETFTIEINGDTVTEPNETFSVVLSNATGGATLGDDIATGTITNDDVTLVAIYTIQGAGHLSEFDGQSVTTRGIVTAVAGNGFYIQDATGDGNIATSDGLFVFTSGAPTVVVGNDVRVTGTVDEFIPGGASTGNLSITEIVSPTVTVLNASVSLPTSTVLGVDRTPPTENIDDDGNTVFDAVNDGLDFYESLEGMLVTINQPLAVAGTNGFGEIYTVVNGGAGATSLSERGTLNVRGGEGDLDVTNTGAGSDFNPERIQIDADNVITPGGTPDIDTGALLDDVTGVVTYNFGNFEIAPTSAITVATPSLLDPETSLITGDADTLTVATYNVLNLDPNVEASGESDDDIGSGQFDMIADDIVFSLNAPDIIALQEVQDNSGGTNDGTVSASVTLQVLADAILAAGGPQYSVIDNPFITNGESGGQPGANIRTAFLYREDRVSLVQGSVTTIEGEDQATNPNNPFADARLPLVATFSFNGKEITLVNNHFSSKGGSEPLFGTNQPAANGSAAQRLAQAEAVADYVAAQRDAGSDRIVVLGDLNEFEFEESLDPLYDIGLTNLMNMLPEDERYSYMFDGNSQALDHIFVTGRLNAGAAFDAVHVNSEFASSTVGSDHDPLLASFVMTPGSSLVLTDGDDDFPGSEDVSGDDAIDARDGDDTIDAGAGNDIVRGRDGADILVGGSGNDTLKGDSGADSLSGGGDEDTLIGNTGNDTLDGGGSDDVLRGEEGDDVLVGGTGDDLLRGDDNADTLAGGDGLDRLIGGAGADGFQLAALASDDRENILDFQEGIDAILLDGSVYGLTPGALDPNVFVVGNAAQDADDRFIYKSDVGKLYFDADGDGAGAQVLIANLVGAPILAASDFTVI